MCSTKFENNRYAVSIKMGQKWNTRILDWADLMCVERKVFSSMIEEGYIWKTADNTGIIFQILEGYHEKED